MKKSQLILIAGGLVAGWLVASVGFAGELTYQPVNPNFGGSAFNAAPLMNNANAQDDHVDPNRVVRTAQTFADRVDRLVLGQISRGLLDSILDPVTGDLLAGTINTGISTIVITDLGTQLEVTVTNNATGETTTILVPNL